MIKHLFLFLFIILSFCVKAQINLVPNPSFEVKDTCPNNTGQIFHAVPWFNPTQGTPDYLNSCSSFLGVPGNLWGYQNAHLGNAYAGFFASISDTSMGISNYREYLEVKLDSSLIAGVEYFVSFYLSLSDSMNFATDRIGAYFSNDTVQNDSIFGYMLYHNAQVENFSSNYLTDKSSWMKISGSFVAIGGERFLTIGNFHNDYNTDTIAVSGGASPPISDWAGGYYYLDDVCVSTDSMYAETWTGIFTGITNSISVFPNPASTEILIRNFPANSVYHIIDVLGKEVAVGELIGEISRINVSAIREGVYFLVLNKTYSFKVIINH